MKSPAGHAVKHCALRVVIGTTETAVTQKPPTCPAITCQPSVPCAWAEATTSPPTLGPAWQAAGAAHGRPLGCQRATALPAANHGVSQHVRAHRQHLGLVYELLVNALRLQAHLHRPALAVNLGIQLGLCRQTHAWQQERETFMRLTAAHTHIPVPATGVGPRTQVFAIGCDALVSGPCVVGQFHSHTVTAASVGKLSSQHFLCAYAPVAHARGCQPVVRTSRALSNT